MSTLETLKAARALIEDPERWTQGAFARDAEGHSTPPCSPDAVCWCATGALRQVCPEGLSQEVFLALEPTGSPESVNDDEGYAATIAMFDRAIATAEAGAS